MLISQKGSSTKYIYIFFYREGIEGHLYRPEKYIQGVTKQ